ncbi:MAG: metal-dependent phosphohydrolase, partial [Acidobacteria bacterium]
AYDTITSDRTYKKARAAEEAFAELERCDSAQFDPDLVEVFIRKMRLLPYPVLEAASSSQRAPANAG